MSRGTITKERLMSKHEWVRLTSEEADVVLDVLYAASEALAECEREIHEVIDNDWDAGYLASVTNIKNLLKPSLEALKREEAK